MVTPGVAFERDVSEIRSRSWRGAAAGPSDLHMVCVVPQQQAAMKLRPSREGFVWTEGSRLHRLRRYLGFAVSDRIRFRIGAPDDVQAAVPGYISDRQRTSCREIA